MTWHSLHHPMNLPLNRSAFFSHTEYMTDKVSKRIKNLIYLVGIAIAVYLGIRFILPLVVPFLFAGILAVFLHKPVDWLQSRLHLPRPMASILSLVLALAIILLPVSFLLYKGICELGIFVSNYKLWIEKLEIFWNRFCMRVEEWGLCQACDLEEWGRSYVIEMLETVKQKAMPSLMNYSYLSFCQVALFLGKAIVTFVAVILMLNDYGHLRKKIKNSFLGHRVMRIWKNMRRAGGAYFRAQLIIWSMISVVCVLGLFLSGNRYALIVGILIGFCDALPFVGTGIIFIPWLMIKVFQGKYGMAVLYGGIYLICTFIREFSEPKLVGRGLGVHPLGVIVSIYVGIRLFGGAGVLLGPIGAFLVWEEYKIIKENRQPK